MAQLFNNRNTAKIFLFDNKNIKGTFKNTTGGVLNLVGGELISRNATTGDLEVLTSAGTLGRNIPLGINRVCYDALADTAEIPMTIMVSGDVSQDLVVLQGADTLDTVISDRRLKDRILGDTAGIFLIEVDELTEYDNA